jgi:hypothetical protein
MQLAHLWDYAIEYLPEAQKVREHQNTLPLDYSFTEDGDFVDSKPYARLMYDVANKVIERKRRSTATEIAAACLIFALADWELYEPYMFKLYNARNSDLTPENMPDALLPAIAHAVKNLNNVTGRNVQFVSPLVPLVDSASMLQPSELFKYYERHESELIQAALFHQLPDVMNLSHISHLLACNGESLSPAPQRIARFHMELRKAIESQSLKGTHVNVPERYIADCIHRDDFKQWLERQGGFDVIKDCLLINWWTGNEITPATDPASVKNETGGKTGKRDLTRWLKETWINEGKPEGTDFFDALKKYAGENGSPIVEHFTTSKKGAGFRWSTGSATNYRYKKAIQNMVSGFKKEPQ